MKKYIVILTLVSMSILSKPLINTPIDKSEDSIEYKEHEITCGYFKFWKLKTLSTLEEPQICENDLFIKIEPKDIISGQLGYVMGNAQYELSLILKNPSNFIEQIAIEIINDQNIILKNMIEISPSRVGKYHQVIETGQIEDGSLLEVRLYRLNSEFQSSLALEGFQLEYNHYNIYRNIVNHSTQINKSLFDFFPHIWTSLTIYRHQYIMNNLHNLNPGIIHRMGFKYGGPDPEWLNYTANLRNEIKSKSPDTFVAGGLPEHLFWFSATPHYTYQCLNSTLNIRNKFLFKELSGNPYLNTPDTYWIDMSKDQSVEFMTCVGIYFINNGFEIINFENINGVIENTPDEKKELAKYNYFKVIQNLSFYAAKKRKMVYFWGDSVSSRFLNLHGIYKPSYFNENFAPQWQGIEFLENGELTYVLSRQRIQDVTNEAHPHVNKFFYIDNWNGNTDDYTRLASLKNDSRKQALYRSIRRTKEYENTFFISNLNHCTNCVNISKIKDTCWEIYPHSLTQYDLFACGDEQIVLRAYSEK